MANFLIPGQLERAGNLLLDAARGWRLDEKSRFNDGIFERMFRGSLTWQDKDVLQDNARHAGLTYDPHRHVIFWRDLIKGTATAGGFLVGTDVQESVDILRPYSVSASLGIEIETGLVGDQAVPRVSAKSTPQWLETEGTGASANQPTLQQIALSPKNVAVVVQFSRQLSKQANAEQFIRRELLRTLGTAIDQVIINGASVNFQPFGVMNTVGVTTMSGTFTGASANVFKEIAASANAPDAQISFLATPAVRRLLEGRERASGNFVWDNDKVSSRPAFVSTDMPASTLICGAWPPVYLGIWGPGFILEINPYEATNFRSGVIQARMFLSVDVAVRQPSAFVIGSSLT